VSDELVKWETVKDLMPHLAALEVPDDPEGSALAIVQRILSAPSAEAALSQPRAVGAREVLGRDLRVDRVRIAPSDFGVDGGIGVYALLDCVDTETGERMTVTCGALNVLAQLEVLVREQALPAEVRIVESARPTRAGYRPLWLEAAGRF
jgi:hypothetical protein